MFLYAIGDIHGMKPNMDVMLAAIDEDRQGKESQVIFLGDYIDRGPDSCGVIETLLKRPDDIFLIGNHEDMCLNSYMDFMHNGGRETLASYPDQTIYPSHLAFMRRCHLYYKYDKFVFVHAGVDPTLKVEENIPHKLFWERRYAGYNGDYAEGYFVTHGHTPLHGIGIYKNCINIDTGCVFGGPLTAVRYEVGKDSPPWFFQVEPDLKLTEFSMG